MTDEEIDAELDLWGYQHIYFTPDDPSDPTHPGHDAYLKQWHKEMSRSHGDDDKSFAQ